MQTAKAELRCGQAAWEPFLAGLAGGVCWSPCLWIFLCPAPVCSLAGPSLLLHWCPGFGWDRVNFHKKTAGLTQTSQSSSFTAHPGTQARASFFGLSRCSSDMATTSEALLSLL